MFLTLARISQTCIFRSRPYLSHRARIMFPDVSRNNTKKWLYKSATEARCVFSTMTHRPPRPVWRLEPASSASPTFRPGLKRRLSPPLFQQLSLSPFPPSILLIRPPSCLRPRRAPPSPAYPKTLARGVASVRIHSRSAKNCACHVRLCCPYFNTGAYKLCWKYDSRSL
jgi:hypothetical protein